MPLAAQRRARRVAAAVIPAAALLATALSSAAPADAAATGSSIAVGHPSWATPQADKGAVPSSTRITARVYLASQDAAGLAAYAQAVSTPSSAQYGKYLSAAQAAAKFGPSAASTAALKSYLAGHGLSVTAATEHYLDISGTAAQVEAAFSTSLHNFATPTGVHHAPTGDLTLPVSVAKGLLSVVGLDGVTNTAARPDSVSVRKAIGTKNTKATKNTATSTPATTVPEPCSTYWGQYTATGFPAGYTAAEPTDPCSYVPSQLRKAYGVAETGLTGKRATIAIVDAYGSSTMLADANQYATNHGDAAFRPGQYTEYVTPANWQLQAACGGADGWAPEEALDVEMAHGYAPNADVVYVGANSCSDQDLLASWQLIVDKHLADVVSNSWGEIMHGPAGYFDTSIIAPYEQVLKLAAVEGIGFNVSSGDCGDNSPGAASTGANCDPNTTEPQTQWPASDPWATAVGGTALAISSASGSYKFETAMGNQRSVLSADGTSWNPFPGYWFFGGGGGTSEDFNQPWYQHFAVPSKLSHTLMTGKSVSTAHRVLPDVAMNGDLLTSVAVGISDGGPYSEAGYGGTSVSSPSFAGILADAIQARHGRPLGFANPALYLREGLYTDVKAHPAATHIGDQTLSVVYDLGYNADGSRKARLYSLGTDYGLNAGRGFDNATGLGSPNAWFLWSFSLGGFGF
ncbi:S8/S53 family peptidase [Actinocrinis puniceicyclus]|uniref:S8/S53 family peptidase n=1 Tax=Actinocrinis puniceicyclus TaxID=977794 RepID=A0A8J7WM06_9ACTN|nr:S53 family peptidase [Actinocrinis puniceicyclus]MBS2962234.1 S8/S53 family peptidase [Actinocrinis puniceicyclus]